MRAVAYRPSIGMDAGTRRLVGKVWGLAWPVLVENVLQTMVGVVDIFMVSFLGTKALAGVGTSVPVVFVISSAIAAVALGGTVLVAHSIGARDPVMAKRVAKQTVTLGLAVSLALTVVGAVLARPIIGLLGPEPDVLRIGVDYFSVTMWGAIGLVMSFVLGAILRGAGDTRTPMLAGLGMNVVNVIGAYLLIFGAAGFPELGAVGSAWGAVVARMFGALVLAAALWRGRVGVDIRGKSDWNLDVRLARRIFRIGVPSMVEQFLMSSSMLVFSAMIIALGTDMFAAQRITFQILMVAWLPGFAFAVAATTLTGQALGSKNPAEAGRSTWIAAWAATLQMGLLGAVFVGAAEPIVSAFSKDPAIVEAGSGIMRIMALSLPGFGISFVLQGGLRGAGDTQFPMWVTGASSWLVRLPLGWFIGIHLGAGLLGMYWVFLGDSAVRLAAVLWRYQAGGWRSRTV